MAKEKTKKKGNGLKIFLIVLAVLVAAYAIIAFFPRTDNYRYNPMRSQGDMPKLIAHGGGNQEFPDNTLEAFYNAYSVDKNVMMETDVSITKDGVIILSHDTDLDEKTNVSGKIIDWNYSDLMAQEVDFGYEEEMDENGNIVEVKYRTDDMNGVEVTPLDVEYPEGVVARHESKFLATTLEELLVCFPDNEINVEIKQSGETGKKALGAILELLDKYEAFDRVVLASFHEEIYQEFTKIQAEGKAEVNGKTIEIPPYVMYSPAYGAAIPFFILQMLKLDVFFPDNICVLQLPIEQYGLTVATKSLTDAAHKNNIAVHFWTINDVEEMKMLIEIEADGIMSDYPHRLKEVYDSYNK
ncbi:MAG: hypothetical protein E7370_06605 [Clostridiales bacterium]|nr:hypothetical protein [Clostridiales bacterium]